MASTTKILRLGSLVTSAASSLAAESLATGAVIAVPTDTIYGLACLVQHTTAVERLYTIKVLCLLNLFSYRKERGDDVLYIDSESK